MFCSFCQILRMSRLCSNETDFQYKKKKMRSCFIKREYPEKLIDSRIREVRFNIKETNRKNEVKMECHPLLNSLYGIIRKNLSYFNMDQKVKEVFSFQTVVFVHSARILSSYLVFSKALSFEKRGGLIQKLFQLLPSYLQYNKN